MTHEYGIKTHLLFHSARVHEIMDQIFKDVLSGSVHDDDS